MGVAVDRLSSLPDSVLLHILSFLPFDDVVRLSPLCKHLNNLYTFTTFLTFIQRPTNDLIVLKKFISFIDKSLILLNPNNKYLSKFHLEFPFKPRFSSAVTVYLTFVINYKVKELNLVLKNDQNEFYKLPKKLFINPNLEKLNLVFCNFDKIEVVRWDCLKELRIGSMEIRDELFQKIVFGCPVLEFLELDNCKGYSKLDLSCANVSKLVVNGYGEVKVNGFDIEIEAPCVKVLELKGCFTNRNVLLKNLINCVNVMFDFCLTIPKDEGEIESFYEEQRHMLMAMFVSLRHVKDVMLGTWCIEVMSSLAMSSLPFSLASCVSLTLHAPIQERYLPGIIRLLHSSPNLQTLIMHMARPYFEFETCFVPVMNDVYYSGGTYPLSLLSKDWGFHLRKVRICDFEGMRTGQEVLFLRDLLLVTANLETMVIEWRIGNRDASDEFVAESLFNVRKRSKHARIVFKN